jgi:hypothetical protein
VNQAYNNLMQALLGAGISPGAASRLAPAITDVAAAAAARNNTRGTQFSLPAGVGFYPVAGGKDNFALHVSAPNTYTDSVPGGVVFGPGGGALGVSGVSVFDGDMYCEDAGSFGNLESRGDMAVAGHAKITTTEIGGRMECAGSLSVSPEAVQCTAPLRALSSVSVSDACTLNGPVTTNAQITLKGPVIWDRVNRVPFNMTVYSAVGVLGTDTITMTPTVVAVLNNFGQGAARNFKHTLDTKSYALTDLIEFDAENCKIVLKPLDPDGKAWDTKDAKAPNVLVSGTIKITLS